MKESLFFILMTIGALFNPILGYGQTCQVSFSPTSPCPGEPVTFEVTNPLPGEQYSWELNGQPGLEGTGNPFIFTFFESGTFSIEVFGSSDPNNPCSAAGLSITVLEVPEINISAQSGELEGTTIGFCGGNSAFTLSIANAISNPGAVQLYYISWGDGVIDTLQPDEFDGVTPITYDYDFVGERNLEITAVLTNGCTISKTYQVFNGGDPDIGLESSGNTTNLCAPHSIIFGLSNYENNAPGTIYIIEVGDEIVDTLTQSEITDTYEYVFNNTSCGESTEDYENAFDFKITAENPCGRKTGTVEPIEVSTTPQPVIGVQEPANSCPGETWVFTNESININEIDNNSECSNELLADWSISPGSNGQEWELLGNTLFDINELELQIDSPGVYEIEMTITSPACGTFSITEEVIVQTPPVADASSDFELNANCVPQTVSFTDLSSGQPPLFYLWEISPANGWVFTNGTSESSQNPQVLFSEPGQYQVTLTTINECDEDTWTQTLEFSAAPAIQLAAFPDVCSDTILSFDANVVAFQENNEPITDINWTFQTGSPNSSNEEFPQGINFNMPGLQVITVSAQNACGTTTEHDSFNLAELVNVTFNWPDTTLCSTTSAFEISTMPTPAPEGNCFLNGEILPNCQFDPGAADTLNLLYYEGFCIDSDTIEIEVVDSDGLTVELESQPDACDTLSYSPSPFDPNLLYLVDSVEVNAFPVDLVPGEHVVMATRLNEECGNQSVVDTFEVIAPQTVSVNFPDTTLCSSVAPFVLTTTPQLPTGNCFSNDDILPGCLFDPDAAEPLNLLYYSGFCIDSDTIEIEVVDSDGLTVELEGQPDVCDTLSYSPNPFAPNLLYLVDSMEESTFPVNLPPGEHVVIATLLNEECGNVTRTDTFEVIARTPAEFTIGDTTICSSNPPFELMVNPPALSGNCILNGAPLTDCLFEPAFAQDSNLVVFDGPCLIPDSVRIDVVQTDNLGFTLPATICIEEAPFSLQPFPPGGVFTGNGVQNDSLYDPSLARPGLDTVIYSYDFSLPDGSFCPGTIQQVIEVFPMLQTGIEVLDCEGLTVSFDTLNTSEIYTDIEWQFGDGSTSATPSPVHTYPDTGDYEVLLIISQLNGCSDTATVTVAVEPPPVANFQLPVDTLCSGDSIAISNASSGNIIDQSWNFGNGDTSSLATPPWVTYLAPGQDTAYTIQLNVEGGCAGDFIEKDLYVKAGPNPRFVVDTRIFCSGEAVNIFNISANNALFYEWDFGDGSPLFFGKDPDSHTYITAQTDTFLISLTVGNDCDTLTYTEQVVVVPSDVTAFLTVDQTTHCSGDSIRFINSSGVAGAEFFFSDGNSLFGDTVYYTFSSPVDTFLTVTMRVYGCGYDDTTRTLQILAPPDLTATVDEESCRNEGVNFAVSSSVANILIDFGDGLTSSQSQVTHFYDTADSFSYLITATSPPVAGQTTGCTQSIAGTVEVLPSPQAGFSISPPPNCLGATIQFLDASFGAVSDWKWSFGDGNLTSGSPNPTHEYTITGTFPVQLVVIDDNKCRDTALTPVTIAPLPEPSFSLLQPDSCVSEAFLQNTTPVADSFLWQINGMPSSLTDPEINFPEPGIYDVPVSLTAVWNGCTATVTQTVTVTGAPTPDPGFSFSSDACAPAMVSFENASDNYTAVEWNFGDGTSSSIDNPLHTYADPGLYTVQLSLANEYCQVDSNLLLLIGQPLNAEITEKTDVACKGENTGNLTANIVSGNPPYLYNWSDNQDINPALNLSAGVYSLTITDSLGCTISLTDSIFEPEEMLQPLLVEQTDVSCYDAADGALSVAGTGGTPPYTFAWNNGLAGAELVDVVAGAYTVSVTDAVGCTRIRTLTVSQPDPLQISFDASNPPCFGELGRIELDSISGGTPFAEEPTYFVSDRSDFVTHSTVFDSLPAGQYTFYVKDAKNCLDSVALELTNPPEWDLIVEGPDQTIRKCEEVALEAMATASNLSYNWSGPDILSDSLQPQILVQPLQTATYSVQATSGACTKSALKTIMVDETVDIYIPNAFTPCPGAGPCGGENRYFTVFSNYPCVEEIKSMQIIDRWGVLVFEKERFPHNIEEEGWDGAYQQEASPAGEYKVLIEMQLLDKVETYTTTLILIR